MKIQTHKKLALLSALLWLLFIACVMTVINPENALRVVIEGLVAALSPHPVKHSSATTGLWSPDWFGFFCGLLWTVSPAFLALGIANTWAYMRVVRIEKTVSIVKWILVTIGYLFVLQILIVWPVLRALSFISQRDAVSTSEVVAWSTMHIGFMYLLGGHLFKTWHFLRYGNPYANTGGNVFPMPAQRASERRTVPF